MEKIKTGLAAFGMSGQIFHAPFISTNPAFELTAITERSKELSKERYPSTRIVRNFDELIAIEELELAWCCCPATCWTALSAGILWMP